MLHVKSLWQTREGLHGIATEWRLISIKVCSCGLFPSLSHLFVYNQRSSLNKAQFIILERNRLHKNRDPVKISIRSSTVFKRVGTLFKWVGRMRMLTPSTDVQERTLDMNMHGDVNRAGSHALAASCSLCASQQPLRNVWKGLLFLAVLEVTGYSFWLHSAKYTERMPWGAEILGWGNCGGLF